MEESRTHGIQKEQQQPPRARLADMPSLSRPSALLLAAYVLLCLLCPAMLPSPPLAVIFLTVTLAVAALTLRSLWLVGTLAILAFALTGLTGSPALSALLLSMMGAVAYGGFLLLCPRRRLCLLLPPPVFLAALLLTGSVWRATLTLLPIPGALMLAHTFRRGMLRIRAVCYIAPALILPPLLFALGYGLWHSGPAFLTRLPAAIDAWRLSLSELLATVQVGTGEEAGRLVIEGMELALASALFNILPGLALGSLGIFTYLINLVCLTLFRTFERTKYLPRRVFGFGVSLPSALFFLAGLLVALFCGESGEWGTQFAATVAENLYLALLPLMLLVGSAACLRIFLRSSHRFLLTLLALGVLFFAPSVLLPLLAVLGAGDIIWHAIWHGIVRRFPPPAAP